MKRPFTLIEVLIALAILAVVLVSSMQVISNCKLRVIEAERIWANEHLLGQAAEFFLLAGPEAELPPELLPAGFSASCQVNESQALGSMAEHAQNEINAWILAAYHITVFDAKGQEIDTLTIEKIIPAEDL